MIPFSIHAEGLWEDIKWAEPRAGRRVRAVNLLPVVDNRLCQGIADAILTV